MSRRAGLQLSKLSIQTAFVILDEVIKVVNRRGKSATQLPVAIINHGMLSKCNVSSHV